MNLVCRNIMPISKKIHKLFWTANLVYRNRIPTSEKMQNVSWTVTTTIAESALLLDTKTRIK